MARVIEMTNISHHKVGVMLSNGVTVYVEPQGKVCNEDVRNLDEVRSHFKIREPLNERAVPPVRLVVPVEEVKPVTKLPRTKGKKL